MIKKFMAAAFLVLFSGLFYCVNASITTVERNALVDLYTSTNGDNWTSNNWKTPPLHTDDFSMPGTEESWNGVDVERDQVTSISLINNNLTGTLPSSIGNLKNLQTLSLYSNKITGTLPSSIGNLKNLQTLSLYSNTLSGTLPSELGELTNLSTLFICCNEFTGSIPEKLGNLTNLKRLHLQDNKLSGTIPDSLADLLNLEEFYLEGNELTGSIPSQLGSLINLKELRLYYNTLTGPIPSQFGDLESLTTLELGHNQLTGSIPQELANLSSLQNLSLQYNELTGTIPSDFGSLSSLSILDLANNTLTGTIPSTLGNLTNLVYLSIESNQLTGSIPAAMGNLFSLEDLSFSDNELSGTIPEELGYLTQLTSLGLSENNFTGEIPILLGGLSNLEYLSLYHNELSGIIPEELGNLTELTNLYLWENNLTGSIPVELGNLSNLEYLYMCCNQLTGTIPLELGNLTHLTGMNLSNNGLTGNLPDELGNLVNLTEIDLSDNEIDGGIPTELGNLTLLSVLRLNSNELSGNIPKELGNLSNLKSLNLYHNHISGTIPAELGDLTALKYIDLEDNQLGGVIPLEITNLTSLESEGSDFRYNALYTADPDVRAFIDEKQKETNWENTQTVAPEGLTVGETTGTSVNLSWQPIIFSQYDGGYEVYVSLASQNAYTLFGITGDKITTQMKVTGLSTNTGYDFKLRSFTENYWNTIYSDYTNNVTASTTLSNSTPEAHAGDNQDVKQGDTVILDGSLSKDVDGNIATYKWEQTSGSQVTIADPAAAITTFIAPNVDFAGEALIFQLTVTDTLNLTSSHSSTINVYITALPNPEAGPDQMVKQGDTVSLDGSASSDAEGPLASYIWTQISGSLVILSDPSLPQLEFIAPSDGPIGQELTFELRVTDSSGLQAVDYCTITVYKDNFPPTADTGQDQHIRQGENIIISGSASSDLDGEIAAYQWTQISGNPITLSDTESVFLLITIPTIDTVMEVFEFQLTVTDNKGLESSSDVTLTVYDGTGPLVITPVLLSPSNKATDVSLTTDLVTDGFADLDINDTHLKTDWQISTSSTFDTLVLSQTSYIYFTAFSVPELTLQENTTYYWRVRFYDNHSNVSDWSNTFTFTTLTSQNDQNINGIPDIYENDTVDLDDDGSADSDQEDIKSLNTSVGDGQMGISIKESSTTKSIDEINTIDPDIISTIARPHTMPLGLMALRLSVVNPGDTTEVDVYFSQAADAKATWLIYDSITGWTDFSAYATFSDDRKSVKLQLKDGGFGDADGIANGIIVDPCGFGIASWIKGKVTDSLTRNPITNCIITILDLNLTLNSLLDGNFLSMILPGTYDISVSAPGYQTRTLSNIEVTEASIVTKDISLSPMVDIRGLSVSGSPEINEQMTCNVDARKGSENIYYRFSYHPGYGTSEYDGTQWASINGTEYTLQNTTTYAFDEEGKYIVVVWAVKDLENVESESVPILGWSVDVSKKSCKTSISGYEMEGVQTINSPILFTVNAQNNCADTLYYRFSVHPDYGTSDYTGLNWSSMTGTEWVSANSIDYIFKQKGKFIVVAWVTDDKSNVNPDGVPIIGWSVDID